MSPKDNRPISLTSFLLKTSDQHPPSHYQLDNLIKRFDRRAPKITAYAICEWAEGVGLDINADKTDLILFTKRYNVPQWIPPKINEVRLTPRTRVRYLGTVLDSNLTWRANVEEGVKKATIAL